MTSHDFPSLVGSRICHDLANPIGAVGNGVELMAMSSGPSEEMNLVQDALAGAMARLEFFRIAFGAAGADDVMSDGEAIDIAARMTKTGRHQLAWSCGDDLPRRDARATFLAVLCLETALPFGGEINVQKNEAGHITLVGSGRRVDMPPELWEPVKAGNVPEELVGAKVQFGLLPGALRDAGRTLTVTADEAQISVTLS